MSLSFEQVPWMPSPPLAPGHCAIDLVYLRRMTLGDETLEREVLGMFRDQTDALVARLAGKPSDALDLAHTLKGSARAIGAFDLGEAAYLLENALRANSDFVLVFQQLKQAVAETFAAIDEALGKPN